MKTYTPTTLAADIRYTVNDLIAGFYNCETLKLNDTLAVCIGWSDGFDPDDASAIHSKTRPTEVICAAIKAWRSDDMRTDFDYINTPYYDNGDTIDTTCVIKPDDDCVALASILLGEFETMKNLDIDADGHICGKGM